MGFSGCKRLKTAYKNIKEENGGRTDDNDTSESDICAAEDGYIVSIITRSGTPIVKAGDEVKKVMFL